MWLKVVLSTAALRCCKSASCRPMQRVAELLLIVFTLNRPDRQCITTPRRTIVAWPSCDKLPYGIRLLQSVHRSGRVAILAFTVRKYFYGRRTSVSVWNTLTTSLSHCRSTVYASEPTGTSQSHIQTVWQDGQR